MIQTKTISVPAITVGQTLVVSFQFDTPFPDASYATGISLDSNATMPGATNKGLTLTSQIKRLDGMDVTLSNNQSIDQTADIMQVWVSND